MLTLREFVKKLPADEQRRITRGLRLLDYLHAKRHAQSEFAEAKPPPIAKVAGK